LQIDKDKLYKEVVATTLAFYEWPKWVEDKMTKIIFESRYGQSKSKEASNKLAKL